MNSIRLFIFCSAAILLGWLGASYSQKAGVDPRRALNEPTTPLAKLPSPELPPQEVMAITASLTDAD